eukprot:2153774-Amphidinium_carterae.2
MDEAVPDTDARAGKIQVLALSTACPRTAQFFVLVCVWWHCVCCEEFEEADVPIDGGDDG